MSMNDRIEIKSGDVEYGQLAPSKSARTMFTPGKAVSRPGDMNWEKSFRIPTGTPAFAGEAGGPVEMERTRITKLGRNIVSDQTVLAPVVTGFRVETRDEAGVNGENTTADTVQPPNLADRERLAGNDRIKGA